MNRDTTAQQVSLSYGIPALNVLSESTTELGGQWLRKKCQSFETKDWPLATNLTAVFKSLAARALKT